MNQNDEAKIKSIEKFELSEDEVLLIKIDKDTSQGYTKSLANALRQNFPNNTIVFATTEVDFQIYKPKKEL
jgi:superfamily I DNA and RNA helicase